MDFDRMGRLYDYVYSTPMDSPERERRIEELSDTDQAELYDYAVGILSGRISRTESKEDKKMDIMSYEEWKKLNRRVQARERGAGTEMMNFELAHPSTVQRYMRQSLEDEKRRSEIMSINDRAERQRAIVANIDLF